MERRFYNDDGFEQFLRDATEHFRMYPTKKVWRSIYNDIHPSRKWPSLSALLILIASVMFIGVSNTRTQVGKDAAYIASLNLQLEPLSLSKQATASVTGNEDFNSANKTVASNEQVTTYNNVQQAISITDISESNSEANAVLRNPSSTRINHAFTMQVSAPHPVTDSPLESVLEDISTFTSVTPTLSEDLSVAVDSEISGEENLHATLTLPSDKEETIATLPTTASVDENKTQHWIDEYAFYSIQNRKQKKSPWSYHAYITPSFGYRVLHNESNFTPEAFLQSTIIANSASAKLELVHNPAMNFELGGGVYYQLNRLVRLKAGVQMNFTNYKINAFGLSHAGMATVMMNSDIPQNPNIEIRPTYLSTVGTGNEIQLNSSTMQFSVPIGADVRIAGNKEITWYAGATLQPTYVAGGNAFMVSADHKHYIADATILRRFNMNVGAETFISYQPMKGLRLQVGPQLRYQLMSSYIKDYPMNERLYNIGIKMGVTTRF